MTGGVAVILGDVGHNFAAGMTGGMAYVYDPDQHFMARVNDETVLVQRVATNYWEEQLRQLVIIHYEQTGSPRADTILAGWEWEKQHFWQVCPKEMVARLAQPLTESLLQKAM